MPTSGPPSKGADHDWTYAITDRIESVVTSVKDKTTVPATLVARILVYGLVVGVLASVALVLLVVAGVRVLDVYLPFHPRARRVWVADAAGSAIFLASGAFLWRKRRDRHATIV